MDDPQDPLAYESERLRMVREQLVGRGVRSTRVLKALGSVPRHLFVPPEHARFAYEDGPLPIGEGQTISQPYIVALMTEMLRLSGPEKVLEVGTGSGYQAAVLAQLADEIHTVERHGPLALHAAGCLERVGVNNVWIHVGDGSRGWPPEAPYDAIIVTAAAPKVPPPLIEQLADGGRMVIPVGQAHAQFLEYWERRGNQFEHESLVPVAFVPLRGDFGWQEDIWGYA